MSETHYEFSLIFKGLFRCVLREKRLTVLFPDARSPKNSKVTGEALRDHRAVIEFRLEDWKNEEEWRKALPKGPSPLVEINKRNKGQMGIYLLNHQDIRIGVSGGGEFSSGFSIDLSNLPQLEKISPGAGNIREDVLVSGNGCIARVLDIKHGAVSSERVSTFRDEALKWAYSLPLKRNTVTKLRDRKAKREANLATVKKFLKKDLQEAREIHLDLKVTMQVPKDAPVVIDPDAFPSNGLAEDPPAFLLFPKDGQALKVWIKNRELNVILAESDDGTEEVCNDAEFVDYDFELLYELSADPEQERLIPYRSDLLDNGDVTGGGCFCGGCSG